MLPISTKDKGIHDEKVFMRTLSALTDNDG